MNFKNIFIAALAVASASQMQAGGLLTNTNQSISFLRNPARDAAIGIDGVYSNPAGVAFLNEGFHFGLNWQNATQTRTVLTTSPYLDHTLGIFNADGTLKSGKEIPSQRYRGHAAVPFLPSVQAAYNKGPLSYQFNFAVTGGGGKCEFEKGIGTFESAVGQIASQLSKLGVMGYSSNSYMEGKQFYYGLTFGAAYKINDNLSVYGGVRALIASASYTARINNIQVATTSGLQNFGDFISQKSEYLNGLINQAKPIYEAYGAQYDQLKAAVASGQLPEAKAEQYKQIIAAIEGYPVAVQGLAGLEKIEKVVTGDGDQNMNDVNLQSDQSGFGIAPIIGVDYKVGNFNFAAKYEFRTKMSLKNKSNLKEASIDATKQFVDGTSVREDSPALLTVGAQWSPVDIVRLNAGYHHFYDRQSQKFGDKQNKLSNGTNEYLGGVEVDVTDRLIVSAGAQITRYGLTDEYMSDLSFVTNSWSLGFGASYQANKNVKIEAAYFKTFYDKYKTQATNLGVTNEFSRTNEVIGVGLVVDL